MNLRSSLLMMCLAGVVAGTWSHATLAQAPEPQTIGPLTVVNGGAGLDESNAIKRIAPQYRLRVVMADRGGAYDVADQLRVKAGGDVVAEIRDAGPWVLVSLPEGRYTLEANFGGQWQRRDVTVTRSGTTLHWTTPGGDR